MELIGRTLGPYRIVADIARGGMAHVVRAIHLELDREVACKVLVRSSEDDRGYLARFRRESRILASLQHPGIIQVFDCGSADDVDYFAMPLLSDPTLEQIVNPPHAPDRRLSERRAIAIVVSLLEALDATHGAGIIHRDVKPSNVFVSPRDTVVLSDFGLARWTAGHTRITVSGSSVGTLLYMSPEQLDSKPLDLRSDLYSTGLLLYRVTCGRLPFSSSEVAGVIQEKVFEPQLTRPNQVHPEISALLEAVILKACGRDPSDRFATAGEFRTALLEVYPDTQKARKISTPTSTPTAGAGTGQDRKLSRRRWLPEVCGGLIGVAAAAVVLWTTARGPVPDLVRGDSGLASTNANRALPFASAAPAEIGAGSPAPPLAGGNPALPPALLTMRRLWPGYMPSPLELECWAFLGEFRREGRGTNQQATELLARMRPQVSPSAILTLVRHGLLPVRFSRYYVQASPDREALHQMADDQDRLPDFLSQEQRARVAIHEISPLTALRVVLETTARVVQLMARFRHGPAKLEGLAQGDVSLLVFYLCACQPSFYPAVGGPVWALLTDRPHEGPSAGRLGLLGWQGDPDRVGRVVIQLDDLVRAHFSKQARSPAATSFHPAR